MTHTGTEELGTELVKIFLDLDALKILFWSALVSSSD